MKELRITFLLLLSCFSLTAQDDDFARPALLNIKLLEKSEISVLVETNVNSFTCNFTQSEQFKALQFNGEVGSEAIYFQNAVLQLPVSGFNCGKAAINEDFSALLNEEQYPNITIEFTSAKWYNKEAREANKKAGKEIGFLNVLLSIAGISHKKEIAIYAAELTGNTLSCSGKIQINLQEFGLEPPVKFLGLVKVKEAINIRIDLDMEQTCERSN